MKWKRYMYLKIKSPIRVLPIILQNPHTYYFYHVLVYLTLHDSSITACTDFIKGLNCQIQNLLLQMVLF